MADTEQQAYDPAQHGRDTPQSTFGPVVKTERHEDGQIYVITLNRPHRMNAIGDGLGEALYDAFAAFRDDPTARVAILTGAGDRAFCAGADLIATSETRQAQAESGAPTGYRAPRTGKNIGPLAEGMNLWKPTIAAVNGYAIAGGFMYAMQCDIRVMADHARVGIAEVRWNMGGAGWMIPLTRQIGLGSALELMLWGDTQYDAQRCHQLGWGAACGAAGGVDGHRHAVRAARTGYGAAGGAQQQGSALPRLLPRPAAGRCLRACAGAEPAGHAGFR